MNGQDGHALLIESLRLTGELRLPAIGGSMEPLLLEGDELHFKPVGFPELRTGDIVLVRSGDRLLAHRLVETFIENSISMLRLKGDNRAFCDPPFPYEMLVARLDSALRAGQVIYRREFDFLAPLKSRGSLFMERLLSTAFKRLAGKSSVEPETFFLYQWLAFAIQLAPCPPGESELDWERLYAQAAQGRLTPLLSSRPVPGMPDGLQALLERDLRENQARQLLLYQQTEAVLEALESAGAKVMVIKGPVHADELYDNPSWRPMVDLDLVLQEADWSLGLAVLKTQGFIPEETSWGDLTETLTGQVTLLKPLEAGICAIELHRHLQILSERLAVRGEVNMDRAWLDARPYSVGHAHALQLAPEDAIAYAATHWAQHHFFSSIWLVDIALFAVRAPIDWEKLTRQTKADGTSGFLWLALFLCVELLQTPVPETSLKSLEPPYPRGGLIRQIAWSKVLTSFKEAPDARSLMLQMLVLPRLRDGMATLLRGVFPSSTWLRQHYQPEGRTTAMALRLRHWREVARLLKK
jgi:hypothetical protein